MFRSTLSAASLALLASLALPAQSVKLQATIPFDFHVGAANLPAGDYAVTQRAGVILVRGEYAKPQSAATVVMVASAPAKGAGNCLVFNRYGEDYFLSTVWQEDTGAGVMLPKAKREQVRSRLLTGAASALRTPQVIVIRAHR